VTPDALICRAIKLQSSPSVSFSIYWEPKGWRNK